MWAVYPQSLSLRLILVQTRKKKKPRQQRRAEGQVVLTERDRSVLILTGLCQYLTSEQIARDLFSTPNRCRRRLRQLFDAGFLSVGITSSTEPNLVALTAKGKAAIVEQEPALGSRLRTSGMINLAGVEHHLGVVDLRLYAVALGERRQTPLLRWANANGDLQQELGLAEYGLAPDGLAEFAVESGSVFVAMEADCGSESSAVLLNKLERYRVVATDRVIDGLWLAVRGGSGRQASVAALVGRAGLAGWAAVLDHQEIVARPLRELAVPGVGGAIGPKALIRCGP